MQTRLRKKATQTIELLGVPYVLLSLLFSSRLLLFFSFLFFIQTFFAFDLLICFSQQGAHKNKPQKV